MARRTTRSGEPLTYRCEVCGGIHELETGCEFEGDDGPEFDFVAAVEALDKLPPEQREAAFNRAFDRLIGIEDDEPGKPEEYESEKHRACMEHLRVLAGYVTKH